MRVNVKSPADTFISDKVGETLLITLNAKCAQTNAKDPFFSDHRACQLMDDIDYDFSKFDKDIRSSVGVAIRAQYFDQCAIEFISRSEKPIIILVGCGLDTRYDRLGRRAELATFYHMDIPEVMDIRKRMLPPRENETYQTSSMLNTDWLDEIRTAHPGGDFLFIIEGVLMYFGEAEVRSVFANIAERFDTAEFAFDVINKWMSRNSHRHQSVKHTDATFKFGADDDSFIAKWISRYELIDVKFFTDFKAWKRTGIISSSVMAWVPVLKKSGRMLRYRLRKE